MPAKAHAKGASAPDEIAQLSSRKHRSAKVDGIGHHTNNRAQVAEYGESRSRRFAMRMLVIGWEDAIEACDALNTERRSTI